MKKENEKHFKEQERILVFDVETTGFPTKGLPLNDDKQPHVVQLAWLVATVTTEGWKPLTIWSSILSIPKEVSMNPNAEKVHGISKAMTMRHGINPLNALIALTRAIKTVDRVVAHNLKFDEQLIQIMSARYMPESWDPKDTYCTMLSSVDLCNIPGRWGKPKWPKLQELHKFLFGEEFEGAHDALADVYACARCYFELVKRGIPNGG
jgi:DNA polymerase-3 subunit epsilon